MNNRSALKLVAVMFFLIMMSYSGLNAHSPWTGQDKVMHLLTSSYFVYWNYQLNYKMLNNSHQDSLFMSISITSLLGTSKELSDRYVKGTRFSMPDMVYNVTGIAISVFLIQISK